MVFFTDNDVRSWMVCAAGRLIGYVEARTRSYARREAEARWPDYTGLLRVEEVR
jgi:hypothetical protein